MDKRRDFGLQNLRPGDWICAKVGCGQHNFLRNDQCYRCGANQSDAAEDLPEAAFDPRQVCFWGFFYGG
jgi:hypothetical protein